jgi:adenine-specific DNA-methyltransferase
MNTDLLTEDLKKARLEPELLADGPAGHRAAQAPDGLWEVEVNGFDYFDPAAGDLVSGGKKKIAMWSLDTDYDGRSPDAAAGVLPDGRREGWLEPAEEDDPVRA